MRLCTFWFLLTWEDGDEWIDGIDAITLDEARRVAYWNWEGIVSAVHVDAITHEPLE